MDVYVCVPSRNHYIWVYINKWFGNIIPRMFIIIILILMCVLTFYTHIYAYSDICIYIHMCTQQPVSIIWINIYSYINMYIYNARCYSVLLLVSTFGFTSGQLRIPYAKDCVMYISPILIYMTARSVTYRPTFRRILLIFSLNHLFHPDCLCPIEKFSVSNCFNHHFY